MPAWRGWTATSAPGVITAPTWEEWCVRQRRVLGCERHQQESISLGERELARLSFVRWLYQTGRLDPREHDNH
jgi:hypothetical protein